jgi:hypothetical protein
MRKIIEQGVVALDGQISTWQKIGYERYVAVWPKLEALFGDDDIDTTHPKLRKTDGLENGVVGLVYPLR